MKTANIHIYRTGLGVVHLNMSKISIFQKKDVHAQPYTRLKSIFGRNTIYLSKYTETLAVTVGLCQKLTMEHSLQIMTLKGLMMVVAGMILKKL